MPQRVKALASKPDNLSSMLGLTSRRREPTLTVVLLPPCNTVVHMCIHTWTHTQSKHHTNSNHEPRDVDVAYQFGIASECPRYHRSHLLWSVHFWQALVCGFKLTWIPAVQRKPHLEMWSYLDSTIWSPRQRHKNAELSQNVPALTGFRRVCPSLHKCLDGHEMNFLDV